MKKTMLMAVAAFSFVLAAHADDGGTDAGVDTDTDNDTDTDSDADTDTGVAPCYLLCVSEEECLAEDGTVLVNPCTDPEEVCCQTGGTDTETDTDTDEPMDINCAPESGNGCGCLPAGRARDGSILSMLF